jgi:hypothetical protein
MKILSLLWLAFVTSFKPIRQRLSIVRLYAKLLETGDVKDVTVTLEDQLAKDINKYKIEGKIPIVDSDNYVNEYKEEIKRRGVIFPGKSHNASHIIR